MVEFDQGGTPTIACFNKATVALGVDFTALLAALQTFVDAHVAPVWGTPAKIVAAADFVPGAWSIAFLDDADVQHALGYHDLTPDGLPLAKVFVKTALAAGESVSVTASHELVEMLADPGINLWASGPGGDLFAYESADPVEETHFPVRDITLSNFVYPSYFEAFRAPGSVPFDAMGQLRSPFQVLPGGYQIVRKAGRVSEVFGSPEKERAFRREDRRGHRSECRTGAPMRRSVGR